MERNGHSGCGSLPQPLFFLPRSLADRLEAVPDPLEKLDGGLSTRNRGPRL